METADGRYAYDVYPWFNNANDRVAYQRAFESGHPEAMRIAQAMLSQDPLTPDSEIRQNMTTRNFPPRFGYRTDELTISEVLSSDLELSGAHVNTTLWNEFSDSNGE